MPSPAAASPASSARRWARSSAARAAKPSSLSSPAVSPPSVGLYSVPRAYDSVNGEAESIKAYNVVD